MSSVSLLISVYEAVTFVIFTIIAFVSASRLYLVVSASLRSFRIAWYYILGSFKASIFQYLLPFQSLLLLVATLIINFMSCMVLFFMSEQPCSNNDFLFTLMTPGVRSLLMVLLLVAVELSLEIELLEDLLLLAVVNMSSYGLE